MFTGVLMGALDFAIIGPAFPAIQSTFHVSDRMLPWLLNIYVLFNLISTPVMGKFSDLYGRKWIYILDIFLFGMGSFLVVISGSFGMALAGRAIQGFGAGGIFPVATAVIGDKVPKEKQGSALGLIGAVFGLAFIIGPVIGGALLNFNWRYIFALNLPVAALIIIWAYRILPSERIANDISIDWLGILSMVGALTIYALCINHINSKHLLKSMSDPYIFIPYLLSLGLLVYFYFRETRIESPVINPRLLRSKQLLIIYMLAFGAGLAQLAGIYLPSIASRFFGVSHSEASFMMLPLVVALFISAPMAGRLVDTIGSRNVVIIGQIIMITGLAIFGFYFQGRYGFYAAEVLTGAGMAFVVGSPLRYIMNQETETRDRASGQAMLTLFTSTGQLSSAAMVGAIVASMGGGIKGYRASFQVLMYISFFLLILAFGLRGRKHGQR